MTGLIAGLRARLQPVLGTGSGSLRERAIQGGGVLLIGDLYQNLVRLAANLVMTRLLFPEAFGLMLIVNLVFTGLSMMSDLGIRSAIIVKKDDIDDEFLRTAWTMGILRGIAIGSIALALAYPISVFYEQPQLFGLIALVSLAPVIQSLTSPQPILAEKGVRFGRVVLWHAATQTIAIIFLLCWLLIWPTIWALAAHGIISATIAAISSYRIFPGPRMGLTWRREDAWEIFSFGRWVFIATGLTFLARQGDSLIISKWMTAEELGVFSIAVTFAKLVEMLVERLSWSLLFPVYAEIQAGSSERFNAQLRKVKLVLYLMCAPIVLFFALFGRDMITLLYDPRYHGAGWMLEIMAAGSAFFAAGAAILNIPMSFGDSYRHMWLQFFRFIVLLGIMTIGGYMAGVTGLVIGIALSQMCFYPILRAVTHKYGIRDFMPDILFLSAIVAVIALVWNLRGWPIP
ncbi:MAG: oligosaccharide flippase family protein [Gammaproteobacteria bacterium]|nr:oligosaccharide flippase family protein [Gammaproteobacteria bacterium]